MTVSRRNLNSQALDGSDSLPEGRMLRNSALIFAVGIVAHGADHWRRGFNAVTPQVHWAGTVLSIFGVVAIALVLTRHPLAPMFAVAVGFPTALAVAASHLLPHWSSFSDAFPGSRVGALSYVTVACEIAGALALGVAGTHALRHRPRDEGVWRFLWIVLPVWILGIPASAVLIYRLASASNGLVEHANVRLWQPLDRLLSFVWVTPNMHKIHHSCAQTQTDSNYGNLLAIFDRALGTFTPSEHAQSVVYGLSDCDPRLAQSLSALMALPFEHR